MEVYRAILFSGELTADDHFALAELLYLGGDLSAARERYYVAIELDEDFVEARSNLGCVLAEQGELALAEAAFRGALEYHPDYADAHYHLARLLDRAESIGRGVAALAAVHESGAGQPVGGRGTGADWESDVGVSQVSTSDSESSEPR